MNYCSMQRVNCLVLQHQLNDGDKKKRCLVIYDAKNTGNCCKVYRDKKLS